MEPSGHVDTFAREHLPPVANWPHIDPTAGGMLAYPPRLNCATELLAGAMARGSAERVAIHFIPSNGQARESLRYVDLLALANQAARVLVEDYGVIPGARVLLRSPNHPMLVVLWLAVLKAGAIAVTTMPMLRKRELSHILEKASVSLSLCDARLHEELRDAIGSRTDHRIGRFGHGSLDAIETRMATKVATFEDVDTAADDVALIAFTSGTTGPAKASMHFHRDVLAVADLFPSHELHPSPEDIFFGTPPLAFTFGLGALVLFPFRTGASTLLLEKPTAEALARAMQNDATILFTAPTMYRTMLNHVPSRHTLKQCVSSGEHLPLKVFEAWREKTGVGIINALGSTEMLHMFLCSSAERVRPGSLGYPLRGYETRIVNARGEPAVAGTIGRLFVRGPTGCRYLGDPERQSQYVQDGWNFTGDACLMDEDGYYWFVARADEMIVSAGYNISGAEIEGVLLEHPKVLECAVVGVPDDARGQEVKAFVVLRDAEDAHAETATGLQEFVKRELAPYKTPRAVEFVGALPKGENGKIQRYKLKSRSK